eukprot:3660359-Pyramimonas_sp.AAC.1
MTLCQECNIFCARAASILGHGASSRCGHASRCRAERLRCLLESPPQWPAGRSSTMSSPWMPAFLEASTCT